MFFMLISLLGGLLAQWPIGLLSDKYGRRRVIALSALFSGGVSLEFLFASFALLGFFLWVYALSKERIADENLSHFVNMPVASGVELLTPDAQEEER